MTDVIASTDEPPSTYRHRRSGWLPTSGLLLAVAVVLIVLILVL